MGAGRVIFDALVFGEPASKANSRRVVRIANASRLIKSKKALSYAKQFEDQVPLATGELYRGDVCVHIYIAYASRRPDLDETLILDLLQGRAYANDRQVKEKHVYHTLDPLRPRARIIVSALEGGNCASYL